MKKFNKNCLVFVFAAVMLLTGFSYGFARNVYVSTKQLIVDIISGKNDAIETFTAQIEDGTSESLSYHDLLMDVNSAKESFLGTKVINKEGELIVKTTSGSLVSLTLEKNTANETDDMVLSVKKLEEVAANNGAGFLYVAVPNKTYYSDLPPNVSDYSKENYTDLVNGIKNSGVPCLDFSGILKESSYYKTDHHWTVNTGFDATREICEALDEYYGFDYSKEYADINNFVVKKYENWFLGSYGKKVGTFFGNGADDYWLITPKFATDFTESQPFKNHSNSGTFEETLIYKSNLKKDLYSSNPYAAYSGGDFRLQIMKNNSQASKSCKILLIRDSFACVPAPFLALQASELHICDMRNYSYYIGEKLNMEEYIQKIKPDYVVVLYNGASNSTEKYNFF